MNTHIWRYKDNWRNYPGYHLSADAEGCAALLEWLRSPKTRPEFRLQPVTSEVLSVPNNQDGLTAYVASTLFKLLVRPDVGRGYFVFSEASGRLTLECSHQQVECIIGGVEDIVRGRGDYCIGGDDQHVLWFWWYPTQRGSDQTVQRTGVSRSGQDKNRMSSEAGSRCWPLRSAMKVNSPQKKPPFVGLLLRATLWTPVGILLMVIWLISSCATVMMPIVGLIQIWIGDYLFGIGSLAISPVAFFVARFMTKKIWEEPPSLL